MSTGTNTLWMGCHSCYNHAGLQGLFTKAEQMVCSHSSARLAARMSCAVSTSTPFIVGIIEGSMIEGTINVNIMRPLMVAGLSLCSSMTANSLISSSEKGVSDHLTTPNSDMSPERLVVTTSHSAWFPCHQRLAGIQQSDSGNSRWSLCTRWTSERLSLSHWSAKMVFACCCQRRRRPFAEELAKNERRGAITWNQRWQNGSSMK